MKKGVVAAVNHSMSKQNTTITDMFLVLEMNHSFAIDQDDLEKSYISLSKKWHPDTLTTTSTREKLAASQKTALINEAYETVKDPVKRGYHLLILQGAMGETELENTINSPDLLEEIMEDREELDSCNTKSAIESLCAITKTKQSETLQQIEKLFSARDMPLAKLNLHRYRYYDKFLSQAQTKLKSLK